MKKSYKYFLFLWACTPAFAHGQATVTVDEYALVNSTWTAYNYYSQQSPTSVGTGFGSDIGAADMVNHSFGVQGGADNTYVPSLFQDGHYGGAQAFLQDTIKFNSTGIVTFGVLSGVSVGATGNCDAGAGLTLVAKGGGNTEIASETDNGVGGGYGLPTSYTAQTTVTDLNGYHQYGSWLSNLEVTFLATAGVTYTLTSSASAGAAPQRDINGLEYPSLDFLGSAQVDPSWYLNTPSGMTYTTGSGYAINPSPEPTSVLVMGLGLGAIILRARRK